MQGAPRSRDPVTAVAAEPRALGVWPWVTLCAALVAIEWVRHGWLYPASDDPYIYLGYVKRALTPPHELFSYNPGEHSAGTTGLLYYYVLIPVCAALRAALFFLPLERALLLGLWTVNVALVALAGAVFLRVARALGVRRTPAMDAAMFLLFCAHPKFLWGAFSGLENPLAALLAIVLVERLLRRAPAWQASLAAAGLGATRPETLTVLWVVPLVASLAAADRVRLRRRTALAVLAFGGTLVALAAPCRALTGRWFPSSLGARVSITRLTDPGALADAVARAAGRADFWTSEWPIFAVASLGIALLLPRRSRGGMLATFGVLLAFYVARAVLGLFDFSVEDRYVSWTWPLHALVLAAAADRLLPQARRAPRPLAVALLAVSLLPLGEFLRRFERHVDLMHRIVVEPSLWMRANLPASSRICMEPAGAIRVFTDFYLVDAKGLTTTHRHGFRGNYPEFLVQNRIDYVFDRDDPGAQLVLSGLGRELLTWARGVEPWGDIRLWEVGPPRHAVLGRLVAGGSDAIVAVDNDPSAGLRLAPGSSLEVEMARPVPVETVEILVRGAAHAGEWRVELRCADEPRPHVLALVPAPASEPGLTTLAARLELPCPLASVRLSADIAAPAELVELSLRVRGTRIRWLDARGLP